MEECKLLYCDKNLFKICLYLCYFFVNKQQNWFFKYFHYSGLVSRRKLGDYSLNHIFNALAIGLQYTLSFECPNFGLNDLVAVMPKVKSRAIKFSECNIPISEIDSYCNSIRRPANSNGGTMKAKEKVEYSFACSFVSIIRCSFWNRVKNDTVLRKHT